MSGINMKRKVLVSFLLFVLALSFLGCAGDSQSVDLNLEKHIEKDGSYSEPDYVALYLNTYEQLPSNYLTKKEAIALGWQSEAGNLWEVAEGMSIGGDVFGNREGLLPSKEGRKWYECDVNYQGGFRGAERLVYSNDGLIFYTADHYQSYTEIVGKKEAK